MKPIDQPTGLCSLDPVSLAGLAIGGIGGLMGGMMGGGGGSAPTPKPEAPPPAAPPQKPAPAKQAGGATGSSFIGGIPAAPQTSGAGGKTLLGQ